MRATSAYLIIMPVCYFSLHTGYTVYRARITGEVGGFPPTTYCRPWHYNISTYGKAVIYPPYAQMGINSPPPPLKMGWALKNILFQSLYFFANLSKHWIYKRFDLECSICSFLSTACNPHRLLI